MTNDIFPAEISAEILEKGLNLLTFSGIDDGDIYLQRLRSEYWSLSEHRVKNAQYHAAAGLGVRAVVGEQTGFAYADMISQETLFDACRFARRIGKAGQNGTVRVPKWQEQTVKPLYPAVDPLTRYADSEKVRLLQLADQYAYQEDPAVVDVSASFAATYEEVFIQRLDGGFARDIRPLVRFNVNVVLEKNGQRESGYAGGGGRGDYQHYFSPEQIRNYVQKAVKQAQILLTAQAAPAGEMPVVLGNGWTGVLLHEAVGHGLEGDFNRKGSSIFSGKIGEQVCSPLCTVIDDGSLLERRGSLSVDDEGTKTAKNVLIENGILKGYLQDRMNARLMKMNATGNGRRESYAHLPMPRMTNTYLAAGKHKPEEMIASVKRGLLVTEMGGGQVDITNGQFVFSATQAWLIENGKVTAPVKGASLIGQGIEVMQRISMVGDDFALDGGVGNCGKSGQTVPVGVGQPSVKIDRLIVGGTHA